MPEATTETSARTPAHISLDDDAKMPFLDKMGKMMGASYDWSADVKNRRMPVMLIEKSPLKSAEYEGPQFLHVTGQKNDVDRSRQQHISNRRV